MKLTQITPRLSKTIYGLQQVLSRVGLEHTILSVVLGDRLNHCAIRVKSEFILCVLCSQVSGINDITVI